MIELLISLILSTPISYENCGNVEYYGQYYILEKKIVMCKESMQGLPEQLQGFKLFHEIGHKFMYETIAPEEKEAYRTLYISTREARSQGSITYVSEYASFNYGEDFADTFGIIMSHEAYGTDEPMLTPEAQKRYDYVKNLIEKYQ